jgi:membrane protein DedA with SNARE-associated domain
MTVTEYIILFALVAIMGAGLPGPGDASLIAAGTLAGEGRVYLGTVLAVSGVAWLLGSLAGYALGIRKGRGLLDHPGHWEKSRLRLLDKGDRAFAGHTFGASVTMPAFVSGIFRVPLRMFVLGAVVAGIGWIGMYVGLSYFLGAEIAARIGQAGTRLLLGVIVIVGLGLGLRLAYSHWRAAHQHRPA